MDKVSITKWFLIALAVMVGGVYALPILVGVAWNAVTLAFLAGILIACWFLLPAFAEIMAQLGWRAMEMAIQADPISRLKRDVEAHAHSIQTLEKRIADGVAEIKNLESMLREQKPYIAVDAMEEWQSNLSLLKEAAAELKGLRDEEIIKHEEFKRQVKQAEAQYKIGKAFKGAVKQFSFAKKTGPQTQGASIALDQITRELNASQARLQLALSRPKMHLQMATLTEKKETLEFSEPQKVLVEAKK